MAARVVFAFARAYDARAAAWLYLQRCETRRKQHDRVCNRKLVETTESPPPAILDYDIIYNIR